MTETRVSGSHRFMIIGAVVLAVVLAAIGYLEWQNQRLASQVGDLQERVASATAGPSTTSSSASRWEGPQQADYLKKFDDLLTARKAAIDAYTSGGASRYSSLVTDYGRLLEMLKAFPAAPTPVQEGQDAYYAALLLAYTAAKDLSGNSTGENVLRLDSAFDKEWIAAEQWHVALQRVVPGL